MRAFHDLRLQGMLVGLAECLVFLSYQHSDGRFHWFLHFFVGAGAALSLLALHTYLTGHRTKLLLLWMFLGHMLAMLPDILFGLADVPHQPWMDIFLLHISAHFLPGRNWSWYALFLLSLASYFAALAVTDLAPTGPAGGISAPSETAKGTPRAR